MRFVRLPHETSEERPVYVNPAHVVAVVEAGYSTARRPVSIVFTVCDREDDEKRIKIALPAAAVVSLLETNSEGRGLSAASPACATGKPSGDTGATLGDGREG